MYWQLFYQSPKELQYSQNPHGPHLPRDLTPVTQIIFLMSATELTRMISSTMFSRDTELKRETQLELEQVSGNFQSPQDLNGQQISLEDSTLFKQIKLMLTLPLTSIISGPNMTITELEKSTNQKERHSSELFLDPTTDSDLPQAPSLTWTPMLTLSRMNSMLLQIKSHSLTDIP